MTAPLRPLSELRVGDRVRGTVSSHQPWGVIAELQGFEPVGASLDVIRRRAEPGVQRFVDAAPPVGASVDFVVAKLRGSHTDPNMWVDLTCP